MKRLVIGLLLCPPIYCGGFPLQRSPGIADMAALKAEIAALKQELEEAKAEVTAEDGKVKRTDVKKLMGDQADTEQPMDMEPMDMVMTCVTVDGKSVEMHCDVPNCHEVARTFWFSIDTGIMIKRCDKHKDGVVVK